MTLAFIHIHSCMRNQNNSAHFLINFSITLDWIQYVATACWFVDACVISILHSRERILFTWFWKIHLSHWPTSRHLWTRWGFSGFFFLFVFFVFYGVFFFQNGKMLDRTKLYSMILVWMTLTFTQGCTVMGKLELVQSVCCIVAWSSTNVCDGWVREMTSKKVL